MGEPGFTVRGVGATGPLRVVAMLRGRAGLVMRHLDACARPPLSDALRNRCAGANMDPGTLAQILRHLENAYTWRMDSCTPKTHTST